MTKTPTSSVYRITPSLLNSWGYIYQASEFTREAQSDEICLEDKQALATEKALESFVKTLSRVKEPPTEAMQRGIDFEAECYAGNTCVSPIVEGGAFQIGCKKRINVDGMEFELYGILDVLKGGIIYDIKRVGRYNIQKYLHSYQHDFYLMLFPQAYQFTYLAYDGKQLHTETYYPHNPEDKIIQGIRSFIEFLKAHDLLDLYKEKWNLQNIQEERKLNEEVK